MTLNTALAARNLLNVLCYKWNNTTAIDTLQVILKTHNSYTNTLVLFLAPSFPFGTSFLLPEQAVLPP
jgi:hypothetical protein